MGKRIKKRVQKTDEAKKLLIYVKAKAENTSGLLITEFDDGSLEDIEQLELNVIAEQHATAVEFQSELAGCYYVCTHA